MAEDSVSSTPPPPDAGPRVRIGEWFSEAWNLVKPVWVEYVVVILVFQVLVAVGFLLCVVPGLLLVGPLLGGVFVYCGKRAVGEAADVNDLFHGFKKFGSTVALGLILFLIPMGVLGLLLLPPLFSSVGLSAAEQAGSREASEFFGLLGGLSGCLGCLIVPLMTVVYPVVVGTLFVFSYPLVMFRDLSAVQALKESTRLVVPQFWGFLVFLVAGMLIHLVAGSVGSVLLCVGTLVLSPLATAIVVVAQVLAYRDFEGLSAEHLTAYR